MSKSASELSKNLISHFSYIELTRKKTEELYTNQQLVYRDVYFIYYGLYLDTITSFERFIEDLFIGLLTNSHVHRLKSVQPRTVFSSKQLCRKIIAGERNYVDWIPYDRTIKRAEAFFVEGMPFKFLSKSEKKTIEKAAIIRHALAHKSKHSLNRFIIDVIAGASVTQREKEPIGFLRAIYTTFPSPQNRFQEIAINLALIAQKLAR